MLLPQARANQQDNLIFPPKGDIRTVHVGESSEQCVFFSIWPCLPDYPECVGVCKETGVILNGPITKEAGVNWLQLYGCISLFLHIH